ncbi:MAG: ABC transporter permease [Oscillospiraceae bacterium]|jgi:simple sugar transport system permease protein|nr:ABC transporter permease [Oscillospiraceae bacterium]
MKKLKNNAGLNSVAASLMAILLGLIVGFAVLLIADARNALNGFGAIVTGGLSDLKNFGQVLYYATPIIMTGLSVGFAFKTGLFNIGAAGQYMVGAFVAVFVGAKATFLPGHLHWIVAILLAAVIGAIWGMVPGLMKAFCNVNEVITCIMMNYIGLNLMNLLIRSSLFDKGRNQSLQPVASAILPKFGFDKIFTVGATPSSVNSGIVFAVLIGILLYIILQKTTFGYELKACGFNRNAAKYAGINERRSIILSMVIAGALAGVGGALYYLSGAGTGIPITEELAAEGFDGIPVALLGMSNPIGVIFAGIFISYLKVGGTTMQVYGFAPQIISIITAVIIYFSAFSLFFKGLLGRLGKRPVKAEKQKGGAVK